MPISAHEVLLGRQEVLLHGDHGRQVDGEPRDRGAAEAPGRGLQPLAECHHGSPGPVGEELADHGVGGERPERMALAGRAEAGGPGRSSARFRSVHNAVSGTSVSSWLGTSPTPVID